MNTFLWLWTSWVLPNRRVPWRALLPAALVGAVGLEILKVVGGYVVPVLVARSSALYGTLGVVFALLTWLLVLGRLVVLVSVIEVIGWERRHGTDPVVGSAARAARRRRRAPQLTQGWSRSMLHVPSRVAGVAKPIVQPILAVLPELDLVGHEAVATPAGRARAPRRRRIGSRAPPPAASSSARVAIGVALLRRPRADPARAWAM